MMGDVFDAMNRSRKERGSASDKPGAPLGDGVNPSTADDAQPALPIEQVKGQRTVADDAAPVTFTAPPVQHRAPPVSAAAEKALAERQARSDAAVAEADANVVKADGSLNGYSPEIVVH